MDWITIAEIVYLISAVLCAVLYPLDEARAAYFKQRWQSERLPLRYHLTWGHIVRGFGASLVPVLNTIFVGIMVFSEVVDFVADMDNKTVLTHKSDQ